MSEALWTHRPQPQPGSPVRGVWRGAPTTLAELRALRLQLRAVLDDGGRPPGATDDDVARLLQAFEELGSNGVRHGGGLVQMILTTGASGWLLEVSDAAGHAPPAPAVDRDAALGGLGLYLVARLCSAHGWTAGEGGRKVVWASVDFTGDATPPDAPAPAPAPQPAVAGPTGAPAQGPAAAPRTTPGVPRGGAARVRRHRRFVSRAAAPRLSAVFVAVVLTVTLLLAWLASTVNANNNERLLQKQVAQAATLLVTQVAVIQTQMADAGQVATATSGRPAPFTRFAASTAAVPGTSLSLWRVDGDRVEQLAVHGPDPQLPPGGPAPFFTGLEPTGRLSVAGILQGPEPRLAYALMPADDPGGLVVYAEIPLNRQVSVQPGEAFSGLDLAVFLGRTTAADQLVQTTAPLPIRGDTATTRVPFGDTELTVVAASRSGLTGSLSAALPWIVLGVGGVLAVGGGAVVETLSRRRAVAERLAAENQRLYQQQRSIASGLQHALLPEVPHVDGIEIAARYVAGADGMEVGGDWYDVITRPSGECVFVVGDISGRGLPAATTMAALRFAVRSYVAQGDDIATVLTRLRGLLDIEVDHQFATVLLGELDPAAGLVRVVSAGHFGPLLVRAGHAEFLEVPAARPIGVAPSASPAVTEARVSGPATLLAFTDGAVERLGEVLDTGLERLRATAAAADTQPLPELLDELMQAQTGDGGRDDTVILGLRWTPVGG
ncbi:SpoIIE family protein phosphatase [Geodermatophilus ruber]|uniref:Serine phosphatase RsbU, regulator of sigma subunit n=1 Tax=Geodermatophilus ruber TaxID=504800 RepID=A0A1I4ITQ7_9ACTN|nr:SpoIIE family protein phosphatase [Geodermatophilus ruber]SFL57146.1 Serine phosphatase RsbU, regulator of sigma subunit [Geodermatophilus ruber]